jgi:hypothetical protein
MVRYSMITDELEEGCRNTYRVYYRDIHRLEVNEVEQLILFMIMYISIRFKGREGVSWIFRGRTDVWLELVLHAEKQEDEY